MSINFISITNTAFDDDELANELRVETMKKNRDDDRGKKNQGSAGDRPN